MDPDYIIAAYKCDDWNEVVETDEFEEKRKNLRSIGDHDNRVGGYCNFYTSDVRFSIRENGQQVYIGAHKAILASDSSVFERKFFINRPPSSGDGEKVEVANTSVEIFDLFLQSFYNNRMTIRMNHIAKLVQLAEKFEARKCKQVCIDFLLHIVNSNTVFILEALGLAIKYKLEQVSELCAIKITQFGYHLIGTERFLDCKLETVVYIIKTQYVGRDELHLMEHIVRWLAAEHKRTSQQPFTPKAVQSMMKVLFRYVRVDLLPSAQIYRIFEIYGGFFTKSTIKAMEDMCKLKNAMKSTETVSTAPVVTPPSLIVVDEEPCDVIQIPDPMETFRSMLNNELTSDLHLRFNNENKVLPLHRCVVGPTSLKMAEDLYENGFCGFLNADEYDFKYEDALEFRKPFYGHPIEITFDNYFAARQFTKMFSIMDEMYKFSLKSLARKSFTDDNVFHIYDVCEQHMIEDGTESIETDCIKYVQRPGFDFVRASQSTSFLKCRSRTVKFALRRSVSNGSQKMIFDNLIKWSQYQFNQCVVEATPKNLRKAMNEFFGFINFNRMNHNELSECLNAYGDIFTAEDKERLDAMILRKKDEKLFDGANGSKLG